MTTLQNQVPNIIELDEDTAKFWIMNAVGHDIIHDYCGQNKDRWLKKKNINLLKEFYNDAISNKIPITSGGNICLDRFDDDIDMFGDNIDMFDNGIIQKKYSENEVISNNKSSIEATKPIVKNKIESEEEFYKILDEYAEEVKIICIFNLFIQLAYDQELTIDNVDIIPAFEQIDDVDNVSEDVKEPLKLKESYDTGNESNNGERLYDELQEGEQFNFPDCFIKVDEIYDLFFMIQERYKLFLSLKKEEKPTLNSLSRFLSDSKVSMILLNELIDETNMIKEVITGETKDGTRGGSVIHNQTGGVEIDEKIKFFESLLEQNSEFYKRLVVLNVLLTIKIYQPLTTSIPKQYFEELKGNIYDRDTEEIQIVNAYNEILSEIKNILNPESNPNLKKEKDFISVLITILTINFSGTLSERNTEKIKQVEAFINKRIGELIKQKREILQQQIRQENRPIRMNPLRRFKKFKKKKRIRVLTPREIEKKKDSIFLSSTGIRNDFKKFIIRTIIGIFEEQDEAVDETRKGLNDSIESENVSLYEIQKEILNNCLDNENYDFDTQLFKSIFREKPNKLNKLKQIKNIEKSNKLRYYINNGSSNLPVNLKDTNFCPLSSICDSMNQCKATQNLSHTEIGTTHFRIKDVQSNYYYDGKLEKTTQGINVDIHVHIKNISVTSSIHDGDINDIFKASSVLCNTLEIILNHLSNILPGIDKKRKKKFYNLSDDIFNNIIEIGTIQDIFGKLLLKGAGDIFQEINGVCTNGGYVGVPTYQLSETEIIRFYQYHQHPKRLYAANDRPSSVRYCVLLNHGKPEQINNNSFGGYISKSEVILYKRKNESFFVPPNSAVVPPNSEVVPPNSAAVQPKSAAVIKRKLPSRGGNRRKTQKKQKKRSRRLVEFKKIKKTYRRNRHKSQKQK